MPTIIVGSPAEVTIRRSRFISMAYHVTTAEEFSEALAQIRTAWPRATHYVWAYILSTGEERLTDDGEPQATAGAPTLNLLKSQQLLHSAIITARYFGGTKLGTGGLARAYREVAALALDHAHWGREKNGVTIQLRLPYSEWGALQHFLATENVSSTEEFSEDVAVQFLLPLDTWARIENRLLFEISPHSHVSSAQPTAYIEPYEAAP